MADIAAFVLLECQVVPDDRAFTGLKSAVLDKRFNIFKEFPGLKANFDRVKENEGIAKYLKTRPKTDL